MFKAILAILIALAVLTGCEGSRASSTVSAEYTTPSGTVVNVTKTATIESKQDTVNPPEINIDNIQLSPIILGECRVIDSDGYTNVYQEIGVIVDSGNIGAKGNSKSEAEAAADAVTDLFDAPLITACFFIAAGAALFFIPFPLPWLKKLGIALAVAGILIFLITKWLISIPAWVFIVGTLAAIGCLVVYILYVVLPKQAKAVKEGVQTVEYIKKNVLTPEQKHEHFDGPTASVALIQSPSTQKLVKAIRTREGFTQS